MKNLISLYVLYCSLVSCNNNTNCSDSTLLGRYHLDTGLVKSYNNNDTSILPLVLNKRWDKIVLTAEKNKYYFEKCDESFKKYEGTWEYKAIGLDGDCYVYINQKEEARKIPLDPFNIAIRENGQLIILPFKKDK